MSLVIMGCEVKEVPIKAKDIEFDKEGKKEVFRDAKGVIAKKIQVQGSEYKWVYEDGSVCSGKTFKCIKGKPMKPFSKTTLIDTYDTIDITELPYFINNELTYLLVSSQFKDKIKEIGKDKAISFKFVNRGFKIHRAVVYLDPQLDRVLMRCFRGDLRKANLEEIESSDEIEVEDEVEQLSLDDLEV